MKRKDEFRPVLLAIDLGSTHIKAGVFSPAGEVLGMAVGENLQQVDEYGYPVFDPQQVWLGSMQAVRHALHIEQGALAGTPGGRGAQHQTTAGSPAKKGVPQVRRGPPLRVLGVGLTGMAESGLLVDRSSGQPLTPILPWFDRRAESQAQRLAQLPGGVSAPGASSTPGGMKEPGAAHTPDAVARFLQHGVSPSYKCSLARLLWIQEHDPQKLANAVWLGAPEYLAYRLCGAFATDYSLAGRTCAFRIDERRWDSQWLAELGLPQDIFPTALPAGTPLGTIGEYDDTPYGYLNRGIHGLPGASSGFSGMAAELHAAHNAHPAGHLDPPAAIPAALLGAQVIIAGHDHVCAALAAGLLHGGMGGGLVYDSLGTAEALVGAFPQRALDEQDYRSGFSFGLHVAPGFCYWMGGINAAGGSLEWLRSILGEPKLSYPALERLLDAIPEAPGDIFYLPFLNGRGAPNRDPQAHAAFIGLSAAHGRAHLARAVLEGTALELACILEKARRELGVTADVLAAAGGGVYNRRWMQMRADVSGCCIRVLPQAEAALQGAALLAGLGCGVYRYLEEAGQALLGAEGAPPYASTLPGAPGAEYLPDQEKHAAYQHQLKKYRRLVEAVFTAR